MRDWATNWGNEMARYAGATIAYVSAHPPTLFYGRWSNRRSTATYVYVDEYPDDGDTPKFERFWMDRHRRMHS